MAKENEWTEAGGGTSWNYGDLGKGTVLQGVYLTKEENVGENQSNIYNIEVTEGELKSVWGCNVLDSKFLGLKPGMEVKLTYLGKVKNDKSGRIYHDFKIEYRKAPFEELDMDKLLEG